MIHYLDLFVRVWIDVFFLASSVYFLWFLWRYRNLKPKKPDSFKLFPGTKVQLDGKPFVVSYVEKFTNETETAYSVQIKDEDSYVRQASVR